MKVNEKTGEVVFCSESGSRDYIPIDWKYSDESKCFIPVPGKKVDLYAMIQLHKDSTDLSNIIARAKAGDISALNVRTGAYMDVTDAPRSLNDLAAFQARIDKSWDDLDPKVKELFKNDINVFSNALINNELSSVINNYINDNTTVEKVEEVKENV